LKAPYSLGCSLAFQHLWYGRPPALRNALVVDVSQSGQSPDVVSVVAEGNHQGAPTMAITNDPGSPLAQTAESVIDIGAGSEKAMAATKTYTAQLLATAMLSVALGWGKRSSGCAATHVDTGTAGPGIGCRYPTLALYISGFVYTQ
jgi:fructoselysine-6-P-deglycase FrlB-like protein